MSRVVAHMFDSRNIETESVETGSWHSLTGDAVLERLETEPRGLSAEEAARRLELHGPNALSAEGGVSILELVVKQVRSPLIYLLGAAVILSALAQHYVDSVVVAFVILLNTVIGVSQEWRAEKTLDALRRMSAPRARVLRNGEVDVVPAEDVVVGDILVLESGDRVAADARVLDANELRVDESALTGESDPVRKGPDAVDERAALADRSGMVWSSTSVTDGRGHAVVVATGMDSIIGEIAGEVQTTKRMETPLQRRLASLGLYVGVAAVTFAGLIFAIGIARGYTAIRMMLFATAAAVSAIPEGLPAVISVVLALGVQKMAERGAIVRRLPAVETLGSTTVICSDKTGTITRNQMTVTRMWAGGESFRLSGGGFDPAGELLDDDERELAEDARGREEIARLLDIGALNNNATLERLEEEGGRWVVEGNPTEGAMLVAAQKGGIDTDSRRGEVERLDEIPFSSKFKYMATLDRCDGETYLNVKGAFERVLDFCDRILIDGEELELDEEWREEVSRRAREFADDALRVVAGAYKSMDGAEEADRSDAESGLVFVGLWGLLDPPRDEAIEAIRVAHGAGMDVKMITGDHAATAAAIARRAGILGEDSSDDAVVTGAELDEMDDEELAARVRGIEVFARVSPQHKLRIVRALKAHDEVVAMTGDGVNDAPALKQADIGVAMGMTGTEVAKEASDMVLTDDNFATIVEAVEYGRVIFGNLRRVVMFLVTTNLGEIITLAAALVIGMPLPLTAIMILWVNLVTDGVSVLPLGIEPKHEDVLARPPRPAKEGILTKVLAFRIVTLAPVIAVGTLSVFNHYYAGNPDNQIIAQTMAFTTLVSFEWFRAFSTRSQSQSVFALNPFSNRWLLVGIGTAAVLQSIVLYWAPAQEIFETTAISGSDWLTALAVGSTVLFADELWKIGDRVRRSRAGKAERV